jgi:VIT1/CCC1 family predicted Fe2+/Mn2+ transporter
LPNALYAGFFRLVGTLVPLLPYLLGLSLSLAIPVSIVTTLMLLAINGFFVALAAELDIKHKIIELTLTGVILASVAFGLGRAASFLRSLLVPS